MLSKINQHLLPNLDDYKLIVDNGKDKAVVYIVLYTIVNQITLYIT